VPRMLHSAISAFTRVFGRYGLRRGALLIRGASCTMEVWVPALRRSVKHAVPRPGHDAVAHRAAQSKR
jgi:hypothetical protein